MTNTETGKSLSYTPTKKKGFYKFSDSGVGS